jgi:hypothetical protein
MPKSVVFIPGWKDEVVYERLSKRGSLKSARLEALGILAVDLRHLAKHLTHSEDTEEVYIAYHPVTVEERASMRADQLLGNVAERYRLKLRTTLEELWAEAGVHSERGQDFKTLLERLPSDQAQREGTLQIVAKCMRQDDPERTQATGSHIFKVLAAIAIAEAEDQDPAVIAKQVDDLIRLFKLDRDELLVRWHRVMVILSAVDLDLLGLEKLLETGNGVSEKKSVEYLKLMLNGAPEGGFTGMARFVRRETEDLSTKWGGAVDAQKLAVIVGFLERVALLESGGQVESGLAGRLVEDAKGEGRYHSCVWALSQHFADLAS